MLCKPKFLLPFLLLSLFSCQNQEKTSTSDLTLSLNGSWTLIDPENGSQYPAKVPGTVHTDLLANEVIPDPFLANQEQQLQYLEKKDWIYTRSFEIKPEMLNHPHLELVCQGLDTYAKLYLNDSLIGEASNMFHPWSLDIKPYVKKSSNTISIQFSSPFNAKKQAVDFLGYVLPADNEAGEKKYSPFCRKAAYHFGWDWGPRFVTAGIYKDISINAFDEIQLIDYAVHTLSIEEGKALMLLQTTIQSDHSALLDLSLSGHFNSQFRVKQGIHQYLDTFEVHQARLWQPNGRGEAYLYSSPLILSDSNKEIIKQNIQFGIRTIELINERDSIGTSFYFKVNGEAIFAKGANYIPQDVFLTRVEDSDYRQLLGMAKDAGMNMIRVWGGGVYEKKLFYHLCDSLGLLVWQDYMFAGTMYPPDDAFLQEVKQEVAYQSRRLSKHPCLAIWCGNNEIDVAWHNWGWQEKYGYSEEQQEDLWNAYVRLFHDSIPLWLRHANPYIAYTSTSPLSNWGKAENFNHASMHYWGVWHGRADFSSFGDNVGRFMVEYGMQSYPDPSLLLQYMDTTEMHLDSLALKSRQKSYIGNGEILRHIQQYFESPSNTTEFISRSQEVQAMALDSAIDHHLKAEGHCMGSLLWQLNDCWPGPSWSIIDYHGNPKKAYTVVKRRFKE